jgi:hypothetical protein
MSSRRNTTSDMDCVRWRTKEGTRYRDKKTELHKVVFEHSVQISCVEGDEAW